MVKIIKRVLIRLTDGQKYVIIPKKADINKNDYVFIEKVSDE